MFVNFSVLLFSFLVILVCFDFKIQSVDVVVSDHFNPKNKFNVFKDKNQLIVFWTGLIKSKDECGILKMVQYAEHSDIQSTITNIDKLDLLKEMSINKLSRNTFKSMLRVLKISFNELYYLIDDICLVKKEQKYFDDAKRNMLLMKYMPLTGILIEIENEKSFTNLESYPTFGMVFSDNFKRLEYSIDYFLKTDKKYSVFKDKKELIGYWSELIKSNNKIKNQKMIEYATKEPIRNMLNKNDKLLLIIEAKIPYDFDNFKNLIKVLDVCGEYQ